jgi:hypothetical protein
MGRWRLDANGHRLMSAVVRLEHEGDQWDMHRVSGATPFESSDPDTKRIWWSDVGVHQNLTFAVHPDPISGMHCWHQAVTVTRSHDGDLNGDISVDTEEARAVYRRWLQLTRPAREHSPDGTRRPYWMLRPLKPLPDAFNLSTVP